MQCFNCWSVNDGYRVIYVQELGEISHPDVCPTSQDLHQMKAFVCLQPTAGEEAGWRRKE